MHVSIVSLNPQLYFARLVKSKMVNLQGRDQNLVRLRALHGIRCILPMITHTTHYRQAVFKSEASL